MSYYFIFKLLDTLNEEYPEIAAWAIKKDVPISKLLTFVKQNSLDVAQIK